MLKTQKKWHRHTTYGHRDPQTELAQWADSVKTSQKAIFLRPFWAFNLYFSKIIHKKELQDFALYSVRQGTSLHWINQTPFNHNIDISHCNEKVCFGKLYTQE